MDPIPGFLKFVGSHARVAGSLCELNLLGSGSMPYMFGRPELDVPARWLTAIMQALPNLKAFRLQGANFTGLDYRFTPPMRFKLEQLFIEHTETSREDSTIQNILEVLTLFDELDYLYVRRSWSGCLNSTPFDDIFSKYSDILPTPIRIKALDICDNPRPTRFWLGLMRKSEHILW